jgi:nitrogen regulatory protein P-II 2
MKTAMKLVTVVTEGLLKDEVAALLRRCGATGYTVSRSEGEGSRGVRARDWEGPNQKFESIVTAPVSEAIMHALSDSYFESYAVVAWITDVEVLRGVKFGGEG